ncbi:MAG: hypothetical protein AAF242_01500, partial [Bacteroidota bacterium]
EQLVQENNVLIVGRSQQKAEDFISKHPKHGKYVLTDLSLLNNIPALIHEIRSSFKSIDYILHTADILRMKRIETTEGMEKSIVINYYSRVLINQLLLGGDNGYRPERIIHVAAAGFPPSKNFMKNFPLSTDASSFKGHGIGQISNDFYGLYMRDKLADLGIKINVLNPGMVDTDIRRNAQFPKLFTLVVIPIMGLIWRNKKQSPEEYAKLPITILHNGLETADHSVLIHADGSAIKGNKYLNHVDTQGDLYQYTTQKINDILRGINLNNWI